MTIWLVLDMNLPPEWASVLAAEGWSPDRLAPLVVAAIRQHEADLASGAIVTVEAARARVRILPI